MDKFIESMRGQLGAELDAFLRALDAPPALAVRINPVRPGAEAAASAYAEESVPWEKYGRYLRPGAKPGSGIAHFAGAFYVQEASAMLPARVLSAAPGERVLDLCAAPGGKSGQLALALGETGALVANEPNLARAKMLAGNLERLGVKNCAVVSEYPQRLAEKWPRAFDAILVDAPCSGEGMFRRDPLSREQWTPASSAGCARRQAEILTAAAKMLAPGGRMVYSTCTYNELEDEETVRNFLNEHPNMERADFALPGLMKSEGGMLKIWPHLTRGDGQFACLMRDKSVKTQNFSLNSGRDAAEYADFAGEFTRIPEIYHMEMWGDTLIAAHRLLPDMAGLKVITPGLRLCRCLKGRIEPEHALAMADFDLPEIELDIASAQDFCQGLAVPCEGAGWLAAKHMGMPLGWGKASGGTLKNHLPKGLRRKERFL